MLDIKLIRENPDKINELLKRRNPELSIDEVIKIDEERRKIQTQADELRAKRKSRITKNRRIEEKRRKIPTQFRKMFVKSAMISKHWKKHRLN